MFYSLNRSTPAGTVMQKPTRPAPYRNTSYLFNDQLQAVKSAMRTAAASRSKPVQTPVSAQAASRTGTTRIDAAPVTTTTPFSGTPEQAGAVSLAPNPFNPTGGMHERAATAPETITYMVQPETPKDPIETLKAAMEKAGMDPTQIGMQVVETKVFFPAGTYIDTQLVADLGGGRKESFNVDLLMRNPAVAIGDMKRALAG
jgi:hypothetical protein